MLSSIQPTLVHANKFKRFKGKYFIVACLQKHAKNDQPYWEICLSDSTATVKVYCFDQRHFFSTFEANTLVHIEVCTKSHQGKTYLRCVYLEAVNQDKLVSNLDIKSLPSALCPFPSLLLDVVDLFQTIDNKHLKQFVAHTLLQSDVATKYINCPTHLKLKPSSKNCLLYKSLFVAKTLLKNTNLDIEQKDWAIAFSIVHEVGKVNKYTSDSTLSAIGLRVDIDDLSLSICSLPLQELAKKSQVLHYQMRYLFTYGFAGKRPFFSINDFYLCLDHLTESNPQQHSTLAAIKASSASKATELMVQ